MEGRQIGQQRWDDKSGLLGTVFHDQWEADDRTGVHMETVSLNTAEQFTFLLSYYSLLF